MDVAMTMRGSVEINKLCSLPNTSQLSRMFVSEHSLSRVENGERFIW
jgi:hypothetical protein